MEISEGTYARGGYDRNWFREDNMLLRSTNVVNLHRARATVRDRAIHSYGCADCGIVNTGSKPPVL